VSLFYRPIHICSLLSNRLRGKVTRQVFSRYAVTWLYLAGVCAAEVAYTLLPLSDRAALLRWTSTNVHNLQHDPVGSLIASAFSTQGYQLAWPALIALALFGANHALGTWRTAVTCAAGHLAGTLISEVIVAYRVSDGRLPPASRYLVDVGMSYVVLSAAAVALLYGGWLARAAAALDLALLIFIGHVFAGLGQRQVPAVGHVTALLTGALIGTFLLRQRRRKARELLNYAPASSP
jgi:hypothetical protein